MEAGKVEEMEDEKGGEASSLPSMRQVREVEWSGDFRLSQCVKLYRKRCGPSPFDTCQELELKARLIWLIEQVFFPGFSGVKEASRLDWNQIKMYDAWRQANVPDFVRRHYTVCDLAKRRGDDPFLYSRLSEESDVSFLPRRSQHFLGLVQWYEWLKRANPGKFKEEWTRAEEEVRKEVKAPSSSSHGSNPILLKMEMQIRLEQRSVSQLTPVFLNLDSPPKSKSGSSLASLGFGQFLGSFDRLHTEEDFWKVAKSLLDDRKWTALTSVRFLVSVDNYFDTAWFTDTVSTFALTVVYFNHQLFEMYAHFSEGEKARTFELLLEFSSLLENKPGAGAEKKEALFEAIRGFGARLFFALDIESKWVAHLFLESGQGFSPTTLLAHIRRLEHWSDARDLVETVRTPLASVLSLLSGKAVRAAG